MHCQKWRNCRSSTLSAVIFKHFSPFYKTHGCGWKGILVDYILMLKSFYFVLIKKLCSCEYRYFHLTA